MNKEILAYNWAIETNYLKALSRITPEAIAAEKPRADLKSNNMEIRGEVAIIPVRGMIVPRADIFDRIFGGRVGVEDILQDLNKALGMKSIKRVILNIDSPGGIIAGVSELSDFIFNSRGKKEITAYVEGRASSCAYWIASQCSNIIGSRTSIVGSIGTMMSFLDSKEYDKKQGFEEVSITADLSENKNLDPTTEPGRAAAKAVLNELLGVFLDDVSRGRGVSKEEVLENFGRGFEYVAGTAQDKKMIDSIANFEKLVQLGTTNKEFTTHKPNGGGQMDAQALKKEYPEAVAQIENAAIDTLKNQVQAEAKTENELAIKTAVEAEGARVQGIINATPEGMEATAKTAIETGLSLDAAKVSFFDAQGSTPAPAANVQTPILDKLKDSASEVGAVVTTPEEAKIKATEKEAKEKKESAIKKAMRGEKA